MDTLNYLLTCSDISRDAFMLAQLDKAAQLRKEVSQLLDRWIEAEAYAMLGGLFREAKYTAVVGSETITASLSDIITSAKRQLKQAP